jgi:RimJ/RimL family protein N-acetyltransferase
MQRTIGATEAQYLFAAYVFDALGYRRYEWKCDDFNAPSKRAAARFGFMFEGVFSQHMIVKGRNRDTAWFSMLDSEWPARRAAFERCLDPANFDAAGQQKVSLMSLNAG